MSDMISRLSIASVLLAVMALFGCSSGGDSGVAAPLYTGSTAAAAIVAGNAEELSRKATEGVNEATNLVTVGEGIPFAVGVSSNNVALVKKVEEIARKVINGSTTMNLPTALLITSDELNAETSTNEFCGGSVTVPDNIDPNASLNFSMTFNSLCFDDGITTLVMHGTLTFTETASAISLSFINFSVNINGVTETFSGNFSCDLSGSNCTISTDFAGSDGNVYRLTNVSISGDSISGYILSATFYHYEFGEVMITTNAAINYGGCGIYPSTGEISISSSDGSNVTVTFSGCSYSITGVDANSGPIFIIGSWT